MKKIFLYSSCGLLLMATGCSKFLDKEPDNRAKLSTPEKVSQFLATSYPQANYQGFTETMSDNVEDIGNGGTDLEVSDPYRWLDSRQNQQDSPEFYWQSCYAAIAVTNEALETIAEAGNTTAYKTQRGEALVSRAYAHFMLVSLFSKFYDSATAATDPGIPYVLESEKVVIKQYQRNTVKYVYEMIEKDLVEGLPLLEDKNYSVPKFHWNRAAANAFAARFYLYKGNYAKVIQYASESIPGGAYGPNLRGWNDLTSPYNTITDVTELFKVYSKSTEAANLLLVETSSIWARWFYTERYGVGQAKQTEVYPSTDPLTGGPVAYKRYSISNGSHQLIPKIDEYFVRASVNANFGQPYVMVPLFTVEDVLFNHAEALYYTGNVTGAIALLNTYASRRITNYNATTYNITLAKINTVFPVVATDLGTKRLPSVIQAILAYKRADFVHEGMRWFDVLRYKIQVVHNLKTGGSAVENITLTPNDLRRAIQLPLSALQAGLELNKR